MAHFKDMNDHPKDYEQTNFVAGNIINNEYCISVGSLRIKLSEEELNHLLYIFKGVKEGELDDQSAN